MLNKEENLLKLATHITKLRKAKKLSIHGLANAADIEYSLLQRVEKGKVDIQFNTLVAIAQGLEMEFDEMTKGLRFPS
jgi:transcriptional regulator with XRE-family HTH domain